jgi:LuxR family transcriptional regulator, maltose regulon positive regulatory protein
MPRVAATTAPLPLEQPAQDDRTALAASRAYLAQGQVNQAVQALANLSCTPTELSAVPLQFAATSTLGELCVKQGKLHLAAATYQFLLDWVDAQPWEAELFQFYYRLCALYYEWNHLEKAAQYLQRSLIIIAQQGLPPLWSVEGHLRLAWVCWAQGNGHAAQTAMHQASVAAQAADQAAQRQVAAEQAKLWLRLGKLAPALDWANRCGLSAIDHVRYPHHRAYLTLARVLIAAAQASQALCLLQQLQRSAVTDGRNGDLVEILVLRALALRAQGDSQHAWTELAQALCRSEREEYIRTFVDEGQPMVELLQQTAAKGVTLIYIKNLLAVFAHAPSVAGTPGPLSDPAAPTARLVETLTAREGEVLCLVAAGKANDEIAHALSISPTTVKKHLSNIFGKLQAKNRTEAVAKARAAVLI